MSELKYLGRKQAMNNDSWLEAVKNIEKTVSKSEIDTLTESTINSIKEITVNKNSAYAWSGGKDSIVLGDICERANISKSMIGICDLEYPAFKSWIEENKPEGCEIVNTGLGLEWLAKHPEMLFPNDCTKAGRWFSIVQHKAQRIYFKNQNLDILLLGRRHADGNYTGRGTNIYTDGKGVTRYSPLAEWKHEHILAYIHYHELSLPPIYRWKNGYICGTHPWPARQYTESIENGWSEIYNIDPTIVEGAAEVIESAKHFLCERSACK